MTCTLSLEVNESTEAPRATKTATTDFIFLTNNHHRFCFAGGMPCILAWQKVCPTVNLAEKAIIVDGDNDAKRVSEAEVTARAHDLWITL